uniref:Integrase catalytic domain-containing protein n=1 Tax=Strigops habroptila TaxID=2489341 RepID=A0A672UA78_STRHB
MDYIGSLPAHRGCRYVCTAVDTYSGYLIAHPCRRATQDSTIKPLELIILYRGIPLQIQSDNGSHFKNQKVQQFADTNNIQWIFHIPYYPQAAGLIERMNGLLKERLKRLGGGKSNTWRDHLPEALPVLNNRPIGEMETPLMRMATPNLQIKPLTVAETLTYWEIKEGALAPYRATLDTAGLDSYALQMHRLNTRGICVIDTGTGVYIPSGYFGLIAPRSALAIKGIQILGGIIDSDYQGEIKVILLNSGDQDILIQHCVSCVSVVIGNQRTECNAWEPS